MKKFLILFHIFVFFIVSSQKKNHYKDILQSESIEEIESFLKEAHPDDARRMILKKKLVKLKNTIWIKNAKNAPPPMAARPIIEEQKLPVLQKKSKEEEEKKEFDELLAIDTTEVGKKRKVRLLNQLFSQDSHSQDAIIMIKNNSQCNIIIRIQGRESYNLPVSARGENSIVLKKGDYQFTSNVCDIEYSSLKVIDKNFVMALNNASK